MSPNRHCDLGGGNPQFTLSDLVFLPLVARELRAAAKRPSTYYGRMIAGAIWLAVTVNFLLASSIGSIGKRAGLPLFGSLSGALLLWALISAFAGADSISVEKREGTIGFLFLTDLKSLDIVLGKMAAAALPAFYAALAALPMLAICMLLGGVTAAQYAKTGLAILNVFFLGQAVAMFGSALCRLRGSARGIPILVLLVYVAGVSVADGKAEFKGWVRLDEFVSLNNPARPFYLGVNALSGRRDAHTLHGSARSEQRSLRQKALPPGGLLCFWPGASLLLGHRSLRTCSLVAPSPKPKTKQRT